MNGGGDGLAVTRQAPVLAAQKFLMQVGQRPIGDDGMADLKFQYQRSPLEVGEESGHVIKRMKTADKENDELVEFAFWDDNVATTNKVPTSSFTTEESTTVTAARKVNKDVYMPCICICI